MTDHRKVEPQQPPLPVVLLAAAALAIGVLGAVLLTEAGQILDLPRDWVFGFYRYRLEISVALIAVTLALVYLHFRQQSTRHWFLGCYVATMLACVFFMNLFAPYVWLRAQHHSAIFIPVAEADSLLQPDDDVLVLEVNGDARAYPRDWIMVPHIAGDTIGGEEVVMTYCALSNLPQAFTSTPGGNNAEFRVIAQVNNNLIFSDTKSGELYQQITGRGEYYGTQPQPYPVQRMPWHAFSQLYPQGKVFSPNPNFLDRMTIALFNSSLVDHYRGDPLFSTLNLADERLPPGEAVWGLRVGEQSLAIPQSHFGDEDSLNHLTLNGRQLVVAWFFEFQTLGAFYADRNNQTLSVTEVDPYGNSSAGKLERVQLFPGVLWMVWSHWFPDTGIWPATL